MEAGQQIPIAHFIAFAIIGAMAALLMAAAEEHSELFGVLFLFTIGFEVFFIALVMLSGPAAQAAVLWWKGMVGNLMGPLRCSPISSGGTRRWRPICSVRG